MGPIKWWQKCHYRKLAIWKNRFKLLLNSIWLTSVKLLIKVLVRWSYRLTINRTLEKWSDVAIWFMPIDCAQNTEHNRTKRLRVYQFIVSVSHFYGKRVFFAQASMFAKKTRPDKCIWWSKLIINNIRVQWVGCIQSCRCVGTKSIAHRFLLFTFDDDPEQICRTS